MDSQQNPVLNKTLPLGKPPNNKRKTIKKTTSQEKFEPQKRPKSILKSQLSEFSESGSKSPSATNGGGFRRFESQ